VVDADEQAVRTEVRAWLAEHWDPELPLIEWRSRLADAGWACPSWPREWYGRGLPVAMDAVVHEEIGRAGAVGLPVGVGTWLAAPTLLAHATDDLKRRVLRPTLTGELTCCQLFSEPGHGSDLAGLSTRAERDGDEWVINGEKVWNTSAHHADYGILLARTDWDVPKHQGITCFVVPMKQPGIDVRPLRQMNGYQSFNQVYFTDARAPHANVVGDVDRGWPVAQTTLAHERRFASLTRPRFEDATAGRALEEAKAEAAVFFKTYEWYPQRAGRVDLVVELARATGGNHDPVLRQRIASLLSLHRTSTWTAQRAAAARALGRPPGPEGSLGKLASSNVARAAAALHAALAGPNAMLSGEDGILDGMVAEVLVSVPAQSIAGGTDEIQRNIISERVLGLPRDPASDHHVPYRQIPR
jgi:alkylation response protein AidB-like acyl-CoA dehydrogenase